MCTAAPQHKIHSMSLQACSAVTFETQCPLEFLHLLNFLVINSKWMFLRCLELLFQSIWWPKANSVSLLLALFISFMVNFSFDIYCEKHAMQPCGLWPTRLLCPWDSPGKDTGVGCRALLQGISPTQETNPGLLCLLHRRRTLYCWATEEAHKWKQSLTNQSLYSPELYVLIYINHMRKQFSIYKII